MLERRESSDCLIMGDRLGTPGKDGGNCLWSLVPWVACTSTVIYDALSVVSRHSFTCTLSPALTQVTQLWEDNALWHKPWWQKTHGAINKRFYFSSMQKTVSVLLHVAGLTSSRGLLICPGAWLGDSPTLCAEGMNILLLVTMPVCITSSMQHPL